MITTVEGAANVKICSGYTLTEHSWKRMADRLTGFDSVNAALHFGRRIHLRGALVYAIGHREVRNARGQGKDIARHEGVQVVCAP